MSDLPTLIVDRVQADQILDAPCDHADCDVFHAAESVTVRIDGTLPTMRDPDGCMVDGKMLYRRPLRVGDRVTLATECQQYGCDRGVRRSMGRADGTSCTKCDGTGTVPFATATVAKIEVIGLWKNLGYLVIVTDVEALS